MKIGPTGDFHRSGQSFRRLALVLAIAGSAAVVQGEPSPPFRFIYNSDGGNIFIDKPPPMKAEDVFSYVDEVADSSVTSFFVSPNYGQPLLFPNRTAGMIGDNASEEQEKEILEVGPSKAVSMERAILNLRGLIEQGQDPFGIVLDRAKEKGLETFISFRLNEIHNVEEPESLLLTDFWRDHPEWRVAEIGHEPGPVYKEILGPRVHPIVASWFWGALDYSVPEVRTYYLDQLRECCERYPQIDGLELDFQRFPIYFKEGKEGENIPIMNDWVGEVRRMVQEIGIKRGRAILLTARILARPEQNLAIGLDPFDWVENGLIDFVVVSHYLRNDYTVPIKEYRSRFPEGFPIYASIEVEPTQEDFRRIAGDLWKERPDGIYLFNFFTWRERGKEPPFDILNELGRPRTAVGQ